jgi:hypothetical protein
MAATTVRRKNAASTHDMKRKMVCVNIPQSDMAFFQLLTNKMGWLIEKKTDLSKEALWDNYISTSSQNEPLTDEDIMEAIYEVRYGRNE